MKIAIIGSGPVALYAASHFYQIGAHVVLFQRSPLGGNIRFCHSKNIECNVDYPEAKTIEKFWKEDLVPLVEFVEEKKLTKSGDVIRVHKRFLHGDEEVLNRSRLVDLFRVIYSVNPKDSILKQVEENPEVFNKLGEQVLNSLHEPVESFEDFDVVIEATGRGKSDFKMGPSGSYALNEKNLSKHSHFYYGKEFFHRFNDQGLKRIVVVGDDISAYISMMKLEDWLFSNPEHKLIWVKHKPLDHYSFSIQSLIDHEAREFEAVKQKYEDELFKWRGLDDHVKAKIAKPTEPERKLTIYEGYNVTSIDKLLDREGIFVTVESPDFRGYAKVVGDLKTLACDTVIVQNGVKNNEILGDNLSIEEPGYYVINKTSLKECVVEILEIESKLMNFFSKSDQ